MKKFAISAVLLCCCSPLALPAQNRNVATDQASSDTGSAAQAAGFQQGRFVGFGKVKTGSTCAATDPYGYSASCTSTGFHAYTVEVGDIVFTVTHYTQDGGFSPSWFGATTTFSAA